MGSAAARLFFPDSGSDRDSDETFQISRNLGLEHVEFFCLLDSQPCGCPSVLVSGVLTWHTLNGLTHSFVALRTAKLQTARCQTDFWLLHWSSCWGTVFNVRQDISRRDHHYKETWPRFSPDSNKASSGIHVFLAEIRTPKLSHITLGSPLSRNVTKVLSVLQNSILREICLGRESNPHIATRCAQDNLGHKNLGPPSKMPIMCFAPIKIITSRTIRINSALIVVTAT